MDQEKIFSKDEAYERSDQTDSTFKVVIIYDDLSAAIRAMTFLNGVIRQFDDELPFPRDLWRVDILELPEVREAAVATIGAANLIVVSVRGDTELPLSLEECLDYCLLGKAPGSVALVGLCTSNNTFDGNQCHTRRFLQGVADRSLMDFFFDEVDLPNTSPGLTLGDMEAKPPIISAIVEENIQWAD